MALVTVDELKAVLREEGIDHDQGLAVIDIAEASCAAYIGTSQLEEHAVTETIYTKREPNLVELKEGPLTALTSVTIDDVAATVADFETHPWAIWRYEALSAGAKVVVEYTAGWNPQNVPDQVRQGVLAAAANIWARPDADVVRIGTEGLLTAYNRTFITPSVEVLLRRFRRPR